MSKDSNTQHRAARPDISFEKSGTKSGTAPKELSKDSRLRGLRSRKPIGFGQWVVHSCT